SAKHMENLVQDLLEYTHVATASDDCQNWADAKAVLQTVLNNLEAAVDESGATITWDQLPVVQLPAVRLQQVLQNLISNALKYRGSEPPRIHISAVPAEAGWCFSVRDNGMGIAPQYHDK